MKNTKKEDRLLEFLRFAYEVNIRKLRHTELWKLRHHLLKIIDSDLTHFLYMYYVLEDYRKNNEKIEDLQRDLGLIQSGFFMFFGNNFVEVISQNLENIPKQYREIKPTKIPEIRKHGRFLCLDKGTIRFDEYVSNYEDIAIEQLCRLFREGVQFNRYYVCEECGLWKINNRKQRKHWICAPCYKKIYDRTFKRKERSTQEGQKAYNEKQFMRRWDKYLKDNPDRKGKVPPNIREKYLRLKNKLSD